MKHHNFYPSEPENASQQDLLDAWASLDGIPTGLFQLDETTIIEIQALHESLSDKEPENDVRGVTVSTLSGDEVQDEILSVHKTFFDTATAIHIPIHRGETAWQKLLDRLHKNPAALVREEELAQMSMNLRIYGIPVTDDRLGKITNVASVVAKAIEEEDPQTDGEGQLKVKDRAKVIERTLEGETEALMRRVAERMIETDFLTTEVPQATETISKSDLTRLVSLAQSIKRQYDEDRTVK